MKRFLLATFLALILSIDVFAQVVSKFPELNSKDITGVSIEVCSNQTIISITSYETDKVSYYSYEYSNGLFAVVEFVKPSTKANALYLLHPNNKVFKYEPKDFNKSEGPCESLKKLNPKNGSF